MARQENNVFAPLAQRWNGQWENVEAIIEVAPEFAIFDHLLQIAMGRGDNANIHLLRTRAAQSLKFAFLQDPEQFRLKLEWDVTNFVEEQGALVGTLEATGLAHDGAGKGPAFMAEELAFQ